MNRVLLSHPVLRTYDRSVVTPRASSTGEYSEHRVESRIYAELIKLRFHLRE